MIIIIILFLWMVFLRSAIRYMRRSQGAVNEMIASLILIALFPVFLTILGEEAFSHSVIFVYMLMVAPALISGVSFIFFSVYLKVADKSSDLMRRSFVLGMLSVGLALLLFDEELMIGAYLL